ncbi:electron transport complex subunit RsxC [Enterococcus faecalis]|uniref:electron transport complex subunit RsxC n=1 Tax=Enterococcus faecalis TaxID=1351 RepID=UPI003D13E9E3
MRVRLKKRLSGVYLKKRKETEEMKIEEIPPPKKIILPMTMHLGKPAKVVVETGQHVKIGTLVGAKDGLISANIHSSISGIVRKIEKREIRGKMTTAVIIENDFKEQVVENIFEEHSLQEIIRHAGIVGMGGAGFPTDVKFLLKEKQKIETLIINAAECEPFVTADRRLLLEKTKSFFEIISLILDAYQVTKAIIVVESCSKLVIDHLNAQRRDKRIQIHILSNQYPQGAEKLILKTVLNQELTPGKLPIDFGVIILNVSTIYSIYQAVIKKCVLMERIVTVSGTPLRYNRNLLVRIGTPVEALIDKCGGFALSPAKVLDGGPMMGTLLKSLDEPVIKTTNLVLALTAEEVHVSSEKACIRCSECVNACPIGLKPILISRAYRNNDLITAEQLGVFNCIECGACSYICPSKIDLLQDIRSAKQQIREAKR